MAPITSTSSRPGSSAPAAGDDTVAFNGIARAGSGVQQLVGGSGVDRLSWTNGSSAITDLVINSLDGTMFGLGREFATFSSFETVEFRTYDGHTGIFSYTGFDGADKLTVGFTSGTIDTKGGNDTVDIGAGSSVINGGTGNDFIRISYANSSSNLLRGGLNRMSGVRDCLG